MAIGNSHEGKSVRYKLLNLLIYSKHIFTLVIPFLYNLKPDMHLVCMCTSRMWILRNFRIAPYYKYYHSYFVVIRNKIVFAWPTSKHSITTDEHVVQRSWTVECFHVHRLQVSHSIQVYCGKYVINYLIKLIMFGLCPVIHENVTLLELHTIDRRLPVDPVVP